MVAQGTPNALVRVRFLAFPPSCKRIHHVWNTYRRACDIRVAGALNVLCIVVVLLGNIRRKVVRTPVECRDTKKSA